jgi:hypothetical protein
VSDKKKSKKDKEKNEEVEEWDIVSINNNLLKYTLRRFTVRLVISSFVFDNIMVF